MINEMPMHIDNGCESLTVSIFDSPYNPRIKIQIADEFEKGISGGKFTFNQLSELLKFIEHLTKIAEELNAREEKRQAIARENAEHERNRVW